MNRLRLALLNVGALRRRLMGLIVLVTLAVTICTSTFAISQSARGATRDRVQESAANRSILLERLGERDDTKALTQANLAAVRAVAGVHAVEPVTQASFGLKDDRIPGVLLYATTPRPSLPPPLTATTRDRVFPLKPGEAVLLSHSATENRGTGSGDPGGPQHLGRARRHTCMTVSLARPLRALSVAGIAGVLLFSLPATAHADDGAASQARRIVRFDPPHSVHNLRTAHRYLKGTTDAFKLFAAREGAKVRREDAGCQRNSGIYVMGFTRGYAIGGVGECGGYQALWTSRLRGGATGGHWREVFGSQDGWYCPPLKRYHVPSALVGTTCYSPSRHQTIAYHQP